MGGPTERVVKSTRSSSPNVNRAVDTLAGGIMDAYSPGRSIYQAPGDTTTSAWRSSLDAANNPAFSGGIAGAIQSFGNRAAGRELGIDDPLYAQQRARLTDDVLSATNSAFNASGMFGSDQNQMAAGRGLAQALGGLDLAQRSESYGRQSEAAAMLPQLLSGAQLPSSIAASVGASQDAAANAEAAGPTDYLARLSSILGGTAASAGTTQTAPQAPLWQQLLGYVAGNAGQAMRTF